MSPRRQIRCDTTWFTEWRARQISDPVERLRFLKKAGPIPLAAEPETKPRRISRIWALALLAAPVFFLLARAAGRFEPNPAPEPVRVIPRQQAAPRPESLPEIWQVERTADYETYSNGLRIENRFATSNRPRSCVAFRMDPAAGPITERLKDPAGIVFHTTESTQAPFEADQNGRLQLIGESLLAYVRGKRAYHFVIDRFGRVHRIVAETDAANHAGHSVWADERRLYINLNDSFLGVSFEAHTEPGQDEASINPAQSHAAAILTQMLRVRYRIPAGNCVTHAQVSVNPSNMRVGYHTDWASSFPFEQVGLPDNYTEPLPALWACGFEYDPAFLRSGGSRLYDGVAMAEEKVRRAAAEARLPVVQYRKLLRKQYQEKTAALYGSARIRGEK